MRISDWSSDVCSSDLAERGGAPDPLQPQHPCRPDGLPAKPPAQAQAPPGLTGDRPHRAPPPPLRPSFFGAASGFRLGGGRNCPWRPQFAAVPPLPRAAPLATLTTGPASLKATVCPVG